ncbi:MAG: AAA family ATPase [Thermoplasmatota archaeon]
MKVVVFTGLPWSGKSEAVAVAKQMGIPIFRMGDMVWEETKKKGLELNDDNVGTIANDMRKEHGRDIWANRTIEKIKEAKNSNILVIDGVRNLDEIETFKRKLGDDFLLVAIHVSDELRYKRALERGRKDDSRDIVKIKARDHREIGWGLNMVISSADIVIQNEGSLEELQKKVKQIFV